MLFQGTFTHQFNAKNQVAFPSEFRDEMLAHGVLEPLVLVGVETNCLYLIPKSEWVRLAERDQHVPVDRRGDFRRVVHSQARILECDRQGRVLVPEEFKRKVGLEGEVVFVGNKNRVEMWSPKAWAAFLESASREFLADPGLTRQMFDA